MEENLTTVDAQLEKIAEIMQDILDIISEE